MTPAMPVVSFSWAAGGSTSNPAAPSIAWISLAPVVSASLKTSTTTAWVGGCLQRPTETDHSRCRPDRELHRGSDRNLTATPTEFRPPHRLRARLLSARPPHYLPSRPRAPQRPRPLPRPRLPPRSHRGTGRHTDCELDCKPERHGGSDRNSRTGRIVER